MKLKSIARNISSAMPTFLTCLGIVGVVGTAVCAALDTKEALEKIEEAKADHLTKKETVIFVAPSYKRTIAIATGTAITIAGANILNKKQQAKIISAYGVLSHKYLNFRKATKDVVGEEKLREIDAKLAELEAKETALKEENGKLLFYEPVTQTFFYATKFEVRDAEYKINNLLHNVCAASIRDFIEYLPFDAANITEKPLVIAESYGWTYDYFAEWWGGEIWSLDFNHIKKTLNDGTVYYLISYAYSPIKLDYDDDYNFEEFEFDNEYYKRGEGYIME